MAPLGSGSRREFPMGPPRIVKIEWVDLTHSNDFFLELLGGLFDFKTNVEWKKTGKSDQCELGGGDEEYWRR